MMNQITPSNEGGSGKVRIDSAAAKAALTRIQLIHSTQAHLLDDHRYVRCTNDTLDAAQAFLRDNLDLPGSTTYEAYDLGLYRDKEGRGLTEELMRSIIDDLALIWDYTFYRDEISQLAINMSLCPMHFCDWASCFDDEDDDCAQIRAIFPYGHDT